MGVNWAQVLFNSAVTGSLYLIGAVGLTLSYGLSGFPNFAYAEFMTLGAYMGYFVVRQLGFDIYFAFIAAFLACGILGALAYRGVFRFLANRGANKIHLMIGSIALGFIIRHIIGDIWGWPPTTFGIIWPGFDIGPLRVTDLWLALIFTALFLAVIMHLLLTRTTTGKAIRGISSNPELALASGINIERVTLLTWAGGAALAGVAGLFWGGDCLDFPTPGLGNDPACFRGYDTGGNRQLLWSPGGCFYHWFSGKHRRGSADTARTFY